MGRAQEDCSILRLNGVKFLTGMLRLFTKGTMSCTQEFALFVRLWKTEYRNRGGWILNGIGRPLGYIMT